MEQRSIPPTPQPTTNEKIRKLAEANPDLADVLKSKFPEAFEREDGYVEFPFGFFDDINGLSVLDGCALDAGVDFYQGIYVRNDIDVITKPLPNGATAVLFKIKK